MPRPLLVALAALCLAAGCSSGGQETGDEGGVAPANDRGGTAVFDPGPVESDVASPDAGASAPDPGTTDTGPPAPTVEIGTNRTGEASPDSWRSLDVGGGLDVELGPQGLWMVVLAARFTGVHERVDLLGSIAVGGEEKGRLELKNQRLIVGGDGYRYAYNFFVVVDGPEMAGSDALVRVDATMLQQGTQIAAERAVRLTGPVTP